MRCAGRNAQIGHDVPCVLDHVRVVRQHPFSCKCRIGTAGRINGQAALAENAPGQAQGKDQDECQANDDVRQAPVVIQRLRGSNNPGQNASATYSSPIKCCAQLLTAWHGAGTTSYARCAQAQLQGVTLPRLLVGRRFLRKQQLARSMLTSSAIALVLILTPTLSRSVDPNPSRDP